MIAIKILSLLLASVSLVAFIASLSKRDEWWIRMFDFPRLQITFITIGAIVLLLVQWSSWSTWNWILLISLLISLIYQLAKIYPYTFFSKKQVIAYKGEDDDHCISILISNVLTTNKKYDQLIGLVKQYQPDILLALETDFVWEKELEVLEENHPHALKVPLDNL